MASYKVSIKRSAEKELRKVDLAWIPRLVAAIQELARDPFPVGHKKLVGSQHTYRIRVGDYRVVYMVYEVAKEVIVQRIQHRKDVYR
jgi:mRNA interferase RelE/StbE